MENIWIKHVIGKELTFIGIHILYFEYRSLTSLESRLKLSENSKVEVRGSEWKIKAQTNLSTWGLSFPYTE